ncbi:hypothetical protein L1887_14242 [Cichorium endivia]|nr:hypothetical protein L1887_14242 [Cichorium endivia]
MATTCWLRWPEVVRLGTLQQKSRLEGNPFSIKSLSLFNIPKLVELYRDKLGDDNKLVAICFSLGKGKGHGVQAGT